MSILPLAPNGLLLLCSTGDTTARIMWPIGIQEFVDISFSFEDFGEETTDIMQWTLLKYCWVLQGTHWDY